MPRPWRVCLFWPRDRSVTVSAPWVSFLTTSVGCYVMCHKNDVLVFSDLWHIYIYRVCIYIYRLIMIWDGVWYQGGFFIMEISDPSRGKTLTMEYFPLLLSQSAVIVAACQVVSLFSYASLSVVKLEHIMISVMFISMIMRVVMSSSGFWCSFWWVGCLLLVMSWLRKSGSAHGKGKTHCDDVAVVESSRLMHV